MSTSWAHERDSAHLWGEVNKLNQTVGELKAGVSDLKSSVESLRTDVGQFKERLSRGVWTITGISIAASAIFAILIFLATKMWDSVLKPGLAHAVAEQIEPIVDKRVKEAQAAEAARTQTNQSKSTITAPSPNSSK